MFHCKPISTQLTTTCKLSRVEDAPKTTEESFQMENVPYKQVMRCIRHLVTQVQGRIYVLMLIYYHVSCSIQVQSFGKVIIVYFNTLSILKI